MKSIKKSLTMSWKQIDNYCINNITRLDIFVLYKLYTVPECKIEDLLVFYPPEKKRNYYYNFE